MIFYANEGVAQDLYTNSSVLKDVVAIAQKDKTARFVFYIPYGNSMEIIATQVAPLIGYERCTCVHLEDGTGDYIRQYNCFNNSVNQTAFHNAGALSRKIMHRQLTPIEKGQWKYFDPFSVMQSFIERPKGELWFNYPNAFEYVKFPIDAKYRENYVKKDPLVMFAALSENKKTEFLKVMQVNSSIFTSDKPRLVITGSNAAVGPTLDRLNNAQVNMINDAIAKYGNQYKIYFKGHPGNAAFEAILKATYTKGEVVQIPNNIPFEVLNAAGFGGDKILGIHSTLYFGIPQDRIIAIYFIGTQIDGEAYEYIRQMMIPAGAYPSDMSKYKDFYSTFE